MIKKVFFAFVSILTVLCLERPFSLYASGNGFDSVNYQLVDYVTPNGTTSYFNTGYKPNQNTSFIGTFSNVQSQTGFYYGVTSTVSGNPRSIGFKDGSTSYQIRTMNSNTNVNVTGSKFSLGTVFTINQGTTVTTITDGSETRTSNTYTYGNYTLGNLFLFALNNNGPQSMNTTAKLYNLEIYENDVLIHHYYPCFRKSDNVVGLFDGVESVFLAPINGTMVYGSTVSTNYTITTSVSPSGSGTVSGGGSYASGSTVTLTATAASGYVFSRWNDNNTSNPRTITVTSDQSYEAIFELESTPVPTYSISTNVSPSGSGTVQGGGSYNSGVSVILTATPSTGYSFIKWSDNVTDNPRTIVVSSNLSLTAIFEEDSVDPDPPIPPSGWVDWTDEDDSEYLVEINDIDLNKIYWSFTRRLVVDSINIFEMSIDMNSHVNGSNLNHISFLGSYYDNTITGLTACNSSTYNYNTSTQTTTDVLNIQPAIYGTVDSNVGSEDGIVWNMGIVVNGNSSSSVTTTTNGFSNSTEACRLVGMANGDGSIDGTTLLAAGYQKKTITYNDGSTNGHSATFYVPGDENFEFAADLSFLDDLLEAVQLVVNNNSRVYYHYEYELSVHGKDGYLLPEYGSATSRAFIGTIFDWNGPSDGFFGSIDDVFVLESNEYTYARFNRGFSTRIVNNAYDNITDLYWQGTRNPRWVFKTHLNQFDIGFNNINFTQYYTYESSNYGGKIGIGDSYTINSEDAAENNLTQGTLLYINLDEVNFYRLNNNSILNRFNQLGSFLQEWFKRIYDSIGSITGGNESNEIINNVVNEYDIDVETNFNGLLTNVENKKQQIDLTLPEYNIPSNDVSGIQGLAASFKNIYDEVYIDNGLGLLILIPVLLLVLRLIL